MKANEDLRLFRYFTIADHEEEEVFLREQHQKGYEFVRCTPPGFYYFRKCEPKDVIYRLDFADLQGAKKHDYLNMFQDYGWEYLCDMAGWSYFRKEAATGDDQEIFSDNESRLALVEKVIKTRMLPILLIFFVCILPNVFNPVYRYSSVFFVFWAIMFAFYCYIMVRCGMGLLRLKKKYESPTPK